MNKQFQTLLRDLPVSINNLADPSILRISTERKMEVLIQDGHTVPVGLITKGDLSSQWWRDRLSRWSEHLNLFVFASVSHLPKEMEPASTEARYRTINAARESGAWAIAYVRPLIHGINDSPELISEIFHRSVANGAHAIISSGFRGDEEVVKKANLVNIQAPDNQKWMRTLKITSQSASEYMRALAGQLSIPYFTRTQCAIASLMGKERSLNPYYVAPKFGDCQTCSIRNTCSDQAQWMKPVKGSIELLRYLGFQVEVHTAQDRYQRCDVEVRSQCILCCTNCPKVPDMGQPYINIRTWDGGIPSWGEMSLARFLTGGMLATDPAIPPGENSTIRLHPRFEMSDGISGEGGLYGVNSWLVWSEYVPANKCLKCSYCFLSMFEDILPPEYQITVGMSPAQLLTKERVTA